MPPSSPQFTPGQVLAAGRRAEAEGKPDLAEHFFRHVVEHYGATAEAAAAREGLARLDEKRVGQPLASAVAASGQAGDGASDGAGAPARPVNGSQAERGAAVGRSNSGSGDEPAVSSGAPSIMVPEPLLLPAAHAGSRRRYRIGRLVSRVMALAGWLMLLGGLALVPLAWGSKTVDWLPFAPSPAGLAETVKWAAVQVFGGLVLVLLAQVARAIFDMAEDGGGTGQKG